MSPRHSEQRGTSVIQNLLSDRSVSQMFIQTSQHFDIRFLVSLRLAGMTVWSLTIHRMKQTLCEFIRASKTDILQIEPELNIALKRSYLFT